MELEPPASSFPDVGASIWAGEMRSAVDTPEFAAGKIENLCPGQDLPRAPNGATAPCTVMQGWAILYAILPDGRRQVIDFVLPGDNVGLSLQRPRSRLEGRAVTKMRLLCHQVLDGADGHVSHVREDMFEEEARCLDQLVNLGRRTAFERTAFLLLELHRRLEAAGLVSDDSFEFPPTQDVLADALGLSVVHVNRVLQRLRREKLIDIKNRRLSLLDLPRMRSVCDYTSGFTTFNSTKFPVLAYAVKDVL